jgi:hypothetical protein
MFAAAVVGGTALIAEQEDHKATKARLRAEMDRSFGD